MNEASRMKSSPSFFTDALTAASDQRVLTVGQLNRAIAGLLEQNFPLSWIRGEISNFTRAASGHWYFSLKDSEGQIRCVMFRGRNQLAGFVPAEGEAVEIRALVSLYAPRGDLQLNVEVIRRAGQGSLFEAFLHLKAALAAQGLFDAERKRPLPLYPRRIGIVTSLQAAALRDVLSTLRRRAPHIRVIVYPAPVQGQGAAVKLAAMLDCANARAEVDVLLLCRGGGSIEDLWAFNEEVLAHAIARSAIPVVAGVGHETDFTIADFVADARAPTPTAAAELASPERERQLQDVAQRQQRLRVAVQRLMAWQAQRLDYLARRLVSPQAQQRTRRAELAQLQLRLVVALRRPHAQAQGRIEQLQWRLARQLPSTQPTREHLRHLLKRFQMSWQAKNGGCRARLNTAQDTLALLAPQRTLERGYAVLLNAKGEVLRSPAQLRAEQALDVHLAEGRAQIEVAKVQENLA